MSLANVGGVFVVLLAGMGLACLIAVFEFIWKSRKLATEDNVRHSTLICKGFSHTSKHLFVINKQKSPKSSNPTNPPNNDTEGSACRPPVLLRQIKPSVVDYILELWIFSYVTLFENHPKCLIWILAFFVNFCLVTLFDHFWAFLVTKCKHSSLRSQYWMRHFWRFSNTVYVSYYYNTTSIFVWYYDQASWILK